MIGRQGKFAPTFADIFSFLLSRFSFGFSTWIFFLQQLGSFYEEMEMKIYCSTKNNGVRIKLVIIAKF